MAYVPESEDPNAQVQTSTAAPMNQAATPATSSGGTPATAGAASNAQGAPSSPNASKAPPVQNLQAYLQANAPQATGMGQNIANQLTQGYNAVNTDLTNGQNAFENQVNASAVPADYQSTVNQAAANPTQFATNPANVTNFQAIENANYSGPSSFETSPTYQNLNTEVQNAQSNAPDITNTANIEQLVRGQEQNPTTGESNLDSLLLQQSPEGTAAIKAAASPYANLGTALSGIGTTEDSNIANVTARDQAAAASVPTAFTTGPNAVVPAWENSLNQELANAQTGTNTYNTDVANQAANWNTFQPIVNSYEAANPGFTNLAPQPALQQTSTVAPTLQSVATPQDYAEQQALSQLLGTGLGSTPIDQSTVSQAGTYQTPQFNPVDVQGYLNPLAENAVNDVSGLYPNIARDTNGALSPSERNSISLLTGGSNGQPQVNSLQQFLSQLAATKNAPTSIQKAPNDKNLQDYINQITQGNGAFGSSLNNDYTVS